MKLTPKTFKLSDSDLALLHRAMKLSGVVSQVEAVRVALRHYAGEHADALSASQRAEVVAIVRSVTRQGKRP